MAPPLPRPISPYAISPPAEPARPVVFASPHSGTALPGDFGCRADLSSASLRSGEDAGVDRLIEAAPRHGAAVIRAGVSRAYLDLNRAADDRDPELTGGGAGATRSARAAAGYGVVARRTGDGLALYDRILTQAEVEARIETVHAPYHGALKSLVEATVARHGLCIVVDWHSMPDHAARRAGDGPADVVLGDRHGQASAGAVVRRLQGLLEAEGLKVRRNEPFAGGYTTAHWGRPGLGIHAVQVEMRRGLFLDAAGDPDGRFESVKATMDRVIAGFCADPGLR